MSAARDAELLRAEDLRGRQAAQRLFDRPLVLEAGAGTGKTTTLVARLLSWCLGPGWEEAAGRAEEAEGGDDGIAARALEGVVAITFTEAAAAEMAARVAQALSRLAAGEERSLPGFDPSRVPGAPGAEAIARRARALVGALDRLTARTIHAYCRGLLARYPLEAGVHPDLQVDPDGVRVDEVVREVVDDAVREAYQHQPESPLARLATARIGPREIAEALRRLALAAVPAEALERDPFAAAEVEALLGPLAAALAPVAEAAAPLETLGASALGRRLTRAACRVSERLAELPEAPLERAAAAAAAVGAELAAKNLQSRLKEWGAGQFNLSEGGKLAGVEDRVAAAATELLPLVELCCRLDPVRLDRARRALAPLLARVQAELTRRGIASFQSLLAGAAALLAGDAGVRRAERRRIRQLLVDEFQDTDRLQCDLVRALALTGPTGERPGLLLVGDPKQSIYAWRNADLTAYDELVAEVVAAGGERYSLTLNFRSAPPILAEVERAVGPVMREQTGLQPRFEPLLASPGTAALSGFDAAGRAPVEHWIGPPGGRGPITAERPANEEVAELQARAIARDVGAVQAASGVPWSDFAVLLRSTTRIEVFLEALREEGVPFQVSRDRDFYRRREVLDVAALVRAVAQPADHLALLTWLRSPSVGVPDAALLPLWRREFPRHVTELAGPERRPLEALRRMVAAAAGELPAGLPGLERIEGWERPLVWALETLAVLRRSFRDEPADRFVERLRRATLIEVSEGARYLGAYRLANLERLLRDLEADLEERGGDVDAILRTLRRNVRAIADTDQALPKDVVEDAVQIFTIHAAKGLEFGHVYLPELHIGPPPDEPAALDLDERWRPGADLEYVLFTAPTPGFHRVKAERRRVEAAERVRTLYVALTRARERLVLVGRWDDEPKERTADEADSYAALLGSRRELPRPFAALRESAADPRGADAGGARWKLLRDDLLAPAGDGARRQAAAGASVAAIRRETAELERRRGAARERRQRPWSTTAAGAAAERLAALYELDEGEGVAGSRDAALAAGSAVHRALETWDFDADPDRELARQTERMVSHLERLTAGGARAEAEERAREVLARFRDGPLWPRFLALAGQVVGREIPLVLPAGDDSEAAVFVAGAIDLVYRRQDDGHLAIVDYKTDRVAAGEVGERAAAYAAQEAVYRRAVADHLGLERPPAVELWFLWPGELWQSPRHEDGESGGLG